MIVDAYGALELLSKHQRIDASRIAVTGFSKGGFVALYSSLKRFRQMHGPADVHFAAHTTFYASCYTTYVEDQQASDCAIRLCHGTADAYGSIGPCRT